MKIRDLSYILSDSVTKVIIFMLKTISIYEYVFTIFDIASIPNQQLYNDYEF